jgi:hypothetical protein
MVRLLLEAGAVVMKDFEVMFASRPAVVRVLREQLATYASPVMK